MIIEFFIFILTTLFVYYIYTHKRILKYYKTNDVKYVSGVPVFGNMMKSTLLRQHLAEDIEDVYKAYPDERYVGFIEYTKPTILIRDPDLIKIITVKDFDHFVDHKDFFSEFSPLMKASVFNMKGDKWRDMRMTLSPAFTGSKMKQMVPIMAQIGNNIVDYLKGHLGENINVRDVIQRYTSDVIASTVFGVKVNSVKDRDNEFYKTGQRIFNFTIKQKFFMFFATLFPKLAKIMNVKLFPDDIVTFFRTIVANAIGYREKNMIETADMIQLLMDAAKGKLKNNNNNKQDSKDIGFATTEEELGQHEVTRKWSLDELAGQVFIFFIAGFETTASVLTMCIHELAINPTIQEKLYKEVKDFEVKNEKLVYENISQLKYLDCIFNETLRKWSPATAIDRICTKSYELPPSKPGAMPYQVNYGDLIYYSIRPIHMDPKYYPEPKIFNPDRFSDENKHNIEPFTFMPFGVGPRNCVGSRFALLEVKTLIYMLILNFKIVKCEKTSDPICMLPDMFNINAVGGTWVKMEARNQ